MRTALTLRRRPSAVLRMDFSCERWTLARYETARLAHAGTPRKQSTKWHILLRQEMMKRHGFSKLFSCGCCSSFTTPSNTVGVRRASATLEKQLACHLTSPCSCNMKVTHTDPVTAIQHSRRNADMGSKSWLALVRNTNEFWILSPVGAGLRGTWSALELEGREANDEAQSEWDGSHLRR